MSSVIGKGMNLEKRHAILIVVPFLLSLTLLISHSEAKKGATSAKASKELLELEREANQLSVRYKNSPISHGQLAEHRLVDAQVLFNLKDYARAAILLFDYVDRFRNTPGYGEAVFYLAESLYKKRDFLSAQSFYREIAFSIGGKYYQTALQRLLELSLQTGDNSDVTTYFKALENIPEEQLDSSVSYVKGKYFYFKGKEKDAEAAFYAIKKGLGYYLHAQYFIGAMFVKKGQFDKAEKVFRRIVEDKSKKKPDLQVKELAHLALGRLHYRKNNLESALKQYLKIDRKSKTFESALHEISWTYVKAGEYQRAYRALEILILSHPESPFVPEGRVLQGNLLIRLKEFSRATKFFSETREQLIPIEARMKELMLNQDNSQLFFDMLLARNAQNFSVKARVPKLAVHWVKSLPDIKRLLALVKDMKEIEDGLAKTSRLIDRLDYAIKSPTRIRIFPEFASAKAHYLELDNRNLNISLRTYLEIAQLLENSKKSHLKEIAGNIRSKLEPFKQELKDLPDSVFAYQDRENALKGKISALSHRLTKLSVVIDSLQAQLVATEKYFSDTIGKSKGVRSKGFYKDVYSIRALIEKNRGFYSRLKEEIEVAKDEVGLGGPREYSERKMKQSYKNKAESVWSLLPKSDVALAKADRGKYFRAIENLRLTRTIEGNLSVFDRNLEKGVSNKLEDSEAALKKERANLARYISEVKLHNQHIKNVSVYATNRGFQNIASKFYDLIIRADIGIIDVAWALKEERTQNINDLMAEQRRRMTVLDQEFSEILRSKD